MLGKLMKYEWKATWKLLVPMNLIIILMSVLAYVTVRLSFFDSNNYLVTMTGIIMLLAYILSMFVIMVGTMIYLIYRFYASVYGDEGYLLHTLPVDKHHIIIAKTVVSALWVICSTVLIYLSVIFLFSARREFLETISDGFGYYLDLWGRNGRVGGFTILMTFVTSFIAMIARILKVTACISLGQLSSNHKVLSAFGYYFGIYFVQRMFTVIYFVVLELAAEVSDYRFNTFSLSPFGTSWEFSLISNLIYCVIFYFLTWYVMDKKLNLD